ncbi:serine hydrolase domain-containing protein [Crocinitomix catalasitica]|uniref:serine hydrolase domain-containing protein n=1 Tax=Crocinitomix catalasitica TaxID=184607 RepID=UPI000486B349|nr:serine hydrolase domain-containing protein [Crocinitomix catalasitica]
MSSSSKIIFILLLWCGISSVEKVNHSDVLLMGNDLLISKVDTYIRAWEANNKFSGNVLIAKGDEVLFSKSYGLAYCAFDIENTAQTKFLIGSVTKPFTAYGILLLENRGKLSITDKLSKYFPDFPNAENVSIKHLLLHQSGIRDYHYFSNWRALSQTDLTPTDVIQQVAEAPYQFEPGERFSYTNSGYILLGLIIEQVSGLSFEAFMEKEICEPLQLENTGVINNKKVVKNLAVGYTTSPLETVKADYINYNQPFSSGNMYSTTADLWRFTQAVMSSKLLPKEKTKEIFTSAEFYGYGWGIRNFDGTKAYGHHGGMNGFIGSITFVPDEEYFICFLTNDDNTPKYSIAVDLLKIVQGKAVTLPTKTELIELTETMCENVLGDYLVKPGDTLHIFEEEERIYLQETGQVKHELFPFDQHKFAFSVFEFNAEFSDLIDGKTETLKFVGKSNVIAKRIN